jgi:hypothetical protein
MRLCILLGGAYFRKHPEKKVVLISEKLGQTIEKILKGK